MVLPRHRLPRLWLALTLGSVLALIGGMYWWERQLPSRIRSAAASGRLEECLRLSEQLAALSWLPGRSPAEEGRCRRDRASQLWTQRDWKQALAQQRRLVSSVDGRPEDRRRLQSWEGQLRRQSLQRFQAGDLNAALAALAPLADDPRGDARLLAEDLRQNWERNRQQLERAQRLTAGSRWWEALDALNRLDHPWWRQRSAGLRRSVEQGISRLKSQEQKHHSHGNLPHEVPAAQLDAAVQRQLGRGLDEWQAFTAACRELGGRVEEAGPETACRR